MDSRGIERTLKAKGMITDSPVSEDPVVMSGDLTDTGSSEATIKMADLAVKEDANVDSIEPTDSPTPMDSPEPVDSPELMDSPGIVDSPLDEEPTLVDSPSASPTIMDSPTGL